MQKRKHPPCPQPPCLLLSAPFPVIPSSSSAHPLLLGFTSAKAGRRLTSQGDFPSQSRCPPTVPPAEAFLCCWNSEFAYPLWTLGRHPVLSQTCGDGDEADGWHLLRASLLPAPADPPPWDTCLPQASSSTHWSVLQCAFTKMLLCARLRLQETQIRMHPVAGAPRRSQVGRE